MKVVQITTIDKQAAIPPAVSLLIKQHFRPHACEARGHDMSMGATMKVVFTDARQNVINISSLQREQNETVEHVHDRCRRRGQQLLNIR